MGDIFIDYTHPEHGELRVRAYVTTKGEARILEVWRGRQRCWLRRRNGVYVRHNASINGEQWMCDLANSGVLNALLAQECLTLAKRLNKAAEKLLSGSS